MTGRLKICNKTVHLLIIFTRKMVQNEKNEHYVETISIFLQKAIQMVKLVKHVQFEIKFENLL